MKSVILLGMLVSSLAFADAASFLTIQRTNYKPEKRLYYDLNFKKANCQINTANPFDVYYKDRANGRRLAEFSQESRDYFGPRIDRSKVGLHQVLLQFKAFDEIQGATSSRGEILVNISSQGGKCVVSAEVTYSNKRYTLKHIDITMKKTFGFPTGVDSVMLMGFDEKGPESDCLIGHCR